MEDLTFTCPVCGADVLRTSKSCPECGACEKSGWSPDRYLDGLDLPDVSLERSSRPTEGRQWWQIVAVVLLIALLLLMLRGHW